MQSSKRRVVFQNLPSMALAVGVMVIAGGSPRVTAQSRPPGPAPQASQVAQENAQFEGELEVVYEDSATGARLKHYLNTANKRYQLEFTDAPLDWQSGTKVRASGRLKDADTLA